MSIKSAHLHLFDLWIWVHQGPLEYCHQVIEVRSHRCSTDVNKGGDVCHIHQPQLLRGFCDFWSSQSSHQDRHHQWKVDSHVLNGGREAEK